MTEFTSFYHQMPENSFEPQHLTAKPKNPQKNCRNNKENGRKKKQLPIAVARIMMARIMAVAMPISESTTDVADLTNSLSLAAS